MQLAIGDVLEGKVTGITKFGAFVELPEGKTGMVHISEVSNAYVEDISQHLKEDQVVKVKVINITEEGKISLSIKKAMPREPRPQSFGGRGGSGPRSGGPRGGGSGPRGGARGGRFEPREPRKPFNPQQMSSYEWSPRRSDSASFEDMLSRFKQTSDDKMSDLKKSRGEVRRGSANRRNRSSD